MKRAAIWYLRFALQVALLFAVAECMGWLLDMPRDRALIAGLTGLVIADRMERLEFEAKALRCFRAIASIFERAAK